MRKTFPGCCASAIRTQPVRNKRIARHLTHFRFSILRPSSEQVLDFRLPEQESESCFEENTFIGLLPPIQNRKSKNPKFGWPLALRIPLRSFQFLFYFLRDAKVEQFFNVELALGDAVFARPVDDTFEIGGQTRRSAPTLTTYSQNQIPIFNSIAPAPSPAQSHYAKPRD